MPTRKVAQLGREPREVTDPDGTVVKFFWPAGKDPSETDLDRIVSDYKQGTAAKKIAFNEDPTNLPWYSPSKYFGKAGLEAGIGSLVPQGAADVLAPHTVPHLPESPEVAKTGFPLQDISSRIGRDLYEKAIRPMSSNLGIASTIAGAGLATIPARVAMTAAPILPKILGYGAEAAMIPGTIEAGKEFIKDPSIDTGENLALQGTMQGLGRFGTMAANRVPTPEITAPTIQEPIQPVRQPQKLLEAVHTTELPPSPNKTISTEPSAANRPAIPMRGSVDEPLDMSVQPPQRTPSRETIVSNRINSLKNSRTGITPAELSKINSEINTLQAELDTLKGNKIEKLEDIPGPSEMQKALDAFTNKEGVKVTDTRSVQPEAGELAKKAMAPRIQEEEPIQVTDTRSTVNEPAPRELPTEYQGFDREKFLEERFEAPKVEPPKIRETKPPKSGKPKTVTEPGFEPIENGYQMKKLKNGNVKLRSPNGITETYANEDYARTQARGRGKKEQSQLEPGPIDEESHGETLTLSDGTVLKKGGLDDYGRGNVFQRYDVVSTKSPHIYAEGSTLYHKPGDDPLTKFNSKLKGEKSQIGDEPLTGEIMPDEKRQWKVSNKNPNRIFMTEEVKAKFDKARGHEGVPTQGSTIYYLPKGTIENVRKFDPSLAAELVIAKASKKPLEVTRVDRTPEGRLKLGTAIETAQHEGAHATIDNLGGLHRYTDIKSFMEHPIAKKLAERIKPKGYDEGQLADEVFVNAMSGGSNRKDISPNMLGDFLRDHIDAIIDKNPEQGYKILRSMSGPVREAVIYGGDTAFTKKTGRGFAEWKRNQSRAEYTVEKQVKEARAEGLPEEHIKAHLEKHGYEYKEAESAAKAIKKDPTLERSKEKGAIKLQVIDDVKEVAKGTWNQFVGTIQGRLGRMGLSGKQFKVKFERERTNARTLGEGWNYRFEESIKGLSKSEKTNLVAVVNGTAQPINPKVRIAAGKVSALDQEVQQRAHVHGIATNHPWQNSSDMLKMNEYLIDAAKRVTHAKEFPDSIILDNLISTSKNPEAMKELTSYLFDNLTYARQNKAGKSLSRVGARFEAFSKLAYFTISNIANTGVIPMQTSFKNFAKGIAYAATKEGRLNAKLGGAHWEATRNEMLDVGRSPAAKALALNKIYGITGSESIQRTVAFGAGRAAAKDWFATAKKNPNSYNGKIARKQLNDFLLPEGGSARVLQQAALTEEQLQFAGARMAERTHGFAEKYDLPKSWTSTSWAAIPTMFKRYSLVGTNNVIKAIKVDPIRNIPKLLMLSQVYGEVIGDLKKGIQGGLEGWQKDEDIVKAALKKIQERGQYPKYNWEKDTTLTKKDITAMKRILDNAAQSWFLGMPADAIQAGALKGGRGLLEFLAGPMISDTVKLAAGEMKKTDVLPQPARPIFNKVFPPK